MDVVNLLINNRDVDDIHLAIFDKDGTIIELHHYWGKMVSFRANYIAEQLGLTDVEKTAVMYAMGFDKTAKRLRSQGPVGLKPREVVLMAAVEYLESIGYHNTYNLCYDVFDSIDQISSAILYELIKPIDGVLELLHHLHEKGCKIAIATTDRTERARLAIDYLGCSPFIDCIIGADLVKMPKPHPETIQKILNETGCDSIRTIMVGDALTDVTMGIQAKCQASIGVLTGLTSEKELLEVTPYVINSVSAIHIKE